MRIALACSAGLLLLLALPGAALSATPRWPTAAAVRSATPGLAAKDAACIARYYHGRLSARAWLTPFYKLTPAQKLVTDAGFTHCMSVRQRIALVRREGAAEWGEHPELQCVAARTVARSTKELRSFTTIAREARADDGIYRQCGLMGAIYTTVAATTKLVMTAAERSCANRVGSADPLRQGRQGPTAAQRRAIGAVFDRCVGRSSELDMWTRLLLGFTPRAAAPCVARHSLAISFATIFGDRPAFEKQAKRAVSACTVSAR